MNFKAIYRDILQICKKINFNWTNKNNQNVPLIYFINLDNSKKRAKNIRESAAQIKITNIFRFEAINGQKHKYTEQEDFLLQHSVYNYKTQKGIACCALSHYYLYEKIVNEKLTACIICEDDVVFKENFIVDLNTTLAIKPKNTDLLHLYNTNSRNRDKIVPLDRWRGQGMVCYYITYQGAKKLYDLINTKGLNYSIDDFLLNNTSKINAYITFKSLVQHEDSGEADRGLIDEYKKYGIVLYCYNEPINLKKTLSSLFKSNLNKGPRDKNGRSHNSLICIVDDGSTHLEIVALLNNIDYPNVEIIRNKKRIGFNQSLIKGFDYLNGKCEFMTNVDTTISFEKTWLDSFHNIYLDAKNCDLKQEDFLITGIKASHTSIDQTEQHYPTFSTKVSIDYKHLFFKQSLFNSIIKPALLNTGTNWNQNLQNQLNSNNVKCLAPKIAILFPHV